MHTCFICLETNGHVGETPIRIGERHVHPICLMAEYDRLNHLANTDRWVVGETHEQYTQRTNNMFVSPGNLHIAGV